LKDIVTRSLIHQHNVFNASLCRTDTETGPGVLETALAYTSALRMADNAILFKYLAKSIGIKRGVVPSFMAKPWGNVSMDSIDLRQAYSWHFGSFLGAVGEFFRPGKIAERDGV
jgi:glutamine synthetase